MVRSLDELSGKRADVLYMGNLLVYKRRERATRVQPASASAGSSSLICGIVSQDVNRPVPMIITEGVGVDERLPLPSQMPVRGRPR